MSTPIQWPSSCVSCGTSGVPLESYTEGWTSSYSESAGRRKVRHYHVSTTIRAYLCEECKTRSVSEARFDVAKYKAAIKAGALLLTPFVAFVFFLNAFLFNLQPGAENYPIQYALTSFTSLTSPWLWMILGAVGCVIFLQLAEGYHTKRIDRPFWNHMTMSQYKSAVGFRFKNRRYYESFRALNPHLGSDVKPKFRPRYIPMLSLLWIPIGFSLVGVFIALDLVLAAWMGMVGGILIFYALLWIRIFRVNLSTAQTGAHEDQMSAYTASN